MIEPPERKAIHLLAGKGMSIREISRRMHMSRNTVRAIVRQEGRTPESARKDMIHIDTELLQRLYGECEGYVERMREKLAEEEGIDVGYSTLTRMVRKLGIGEVEKGFSAHVPDKPGEEMQHDTSPYKIPISGKPMGVIASLLYYRYSKQRYLRFYRTFNRFRMKCFFHEALMFYGYAAGTCIIDNTNLARLRGTGKNAVMTPEMEQFASRYGFVFECHEIGHSDRKAGEERSFWTVETNFFPGRRFDSLEDLNKQAFEWATVRRANKPMAKTRLIPREAFEREKPYLRKLPPYMSPPYQSHRRNVDQYGYAAFDANYYWVGGTTRAPVSILQYGDSIEIYRDRKLLGRYPLPPDGVKNRMFSPTGATKPPHLPKHRKKPTEHEEKKLRAVSVHIGEYLDSKPVRDLGRQRHGFIRKLFALSRKINSELFVKTIRRACKYRVIDIRTIERIASLLMTDGLVDMPSAHTDERLLTREQYLEGRISDEPDMSAYDNLLEEPDNG